jgi:serine/threonine-protein kinase
MRPQPTAQDWQYCPTCHAAYPGEYTVCPRDGATLEAGVDRLVGLELRETYRITHLLGEGALGRVYHAAHLRTPRSYAVKVPRGIWVDHAKSRQRFFNEAVAAGRLHHPNIASVIDVGEMESGLPYLVMDHADGQTLREAMAYAPVDARQALSIARQIAAALAHAHAHGVIHRDLKPDNVLVHAGHVRIVDFGIAIITDLGEGGRYTTNGVTIGTPHYMAPEQLYGSAIDARSDLYALGAILYELLTRRKPYSGTIVEYVHQVVEGKLPAFAQRAPDVAVDPRAEALCRHLMAVAPGDRPATAEIAIARIDEILEGLARTGTPRGAARGTEPPDSTTIGTDRTLRTAAMPRVRWWNPATWGRKRR